MKKLKIFLFAFAFCLSGAVALKVNSWDAKIEFLQTGVMEKMIPEQESEGAVIEVNGNIYGIASRFYANSFGRKISAGDEVAVTIVKKQQRLYYGVKNAEEARKSDFFMSLKIWITVCVVLYLCVLMYFVVKGRIIKNK